MSHFLSHLLLLQASYNDVYSYLLATTGLGGIVGYLVARNKFNDGTLDNATDFQGMNADQVNAIASNYGNKNTIPGSTTGAPDSILVWYPMETMVNFLNEISKNAQPTAPGVTQPALGVRFYFSRYPDASDAMWNAPYKDRNGNNVTLVEVLNAQNPNLIAPADYAGKQTVMMVPTYDIVDGANTYHVDFDPWTFTGFASDTSAAQVDFVKALSAGGNLCVMNHGGLMPPPNPTLYASNGVYLNN
jgi:hypothetical protein